MNGDFLRTLSGVDTMPPVTTFQHCKTCKKGTNHEIRKCDNSVVRICVECVKRAMAFELERD